MLNRIMRIAGCVVFMAGFTALPCRAQVVHEGRPGTVNYVEGDVRIGPTELTARSAGTTELARDQVLTTGTGKVELLLTPGVFLRVDDNSSLRMVSPDLADIDVTVESGRAAVEVLDIHKANDIRIGLGDVSTRLLDDGLYEFDANRNQILTFRGKARIDAGGQPLTLKDKHMLVLETTPLRPQKFDTRQYEDNFYRWCALRSGYLSEASLNAARDYVGAGPGWYGPGWYGPGWYWDADFLAYTWLPSDGIFYSPFGWGFYSPIVVYGSPYYFGSDFGIGHHRFRDFPRSYRHGFRSDGGFGDRDGFRGEAGYRAGGGFHGGEGFHGREGFHEGGGFHGRSRR